MKILITGATGLVGSELVAQLLQHNHSIHYLTTSRGPLSTDPHYTGFYWNPEKGELDARALNGVEVIIHLAGASISKRWTKKYKQEIIESRVLSANLLFSTLRHHPHQVKQLISASAIGIYADSLTYIYKEDSPQHDPGFLGQVVERWEESADKFKMLGIKVCKIRTGIVLSNKGGALMEMIKPIKLGLGSPFGSGRQYQSWIHLHDLASMYRRAAEAGWEGTYNGVAPNPVTNAALTKAIAKVLRKPLFMPNIPEFLMQWVLGEMHIILFSSQNVSSAKVEHEGFRFQYETLDKALSHLLALA